VARSFSPRERGFTLAGLLVIVTVIAVVVAYTIPPAWSQIMQREREKQTVWVMKQYARAILEFQRKRNALPVSLDQLKEQNTPRVLRALYPDPLTGEMDWILVPPGAVAGGTAPPGLPPPTTPGGTQPATTLPGDPADYVGPFIGVRPPVSGESYLILNGADRYENWLYTVTNLQQEIGLAAGPTVPRAPQPPPRR
jgi:type II secretory pathway pseudopilin PulG